MRIVANANFLNLAEKNGGVLFVKQVMTCKNVN